MLKWYIVFLECNSVYDSSYYFVQIHKSQGKNKAEAVGKVKSLLKGKGMSEESWTKEFEVVEVFNCGTVEPISE